MQVEQLELDANGLSTKKLAGSATSQEVQLYGAGSYQAGDLHNQNANTRLAGLSQATVWADASLNATLTDTAVLNY
jgi:hypothetical protein